MKVRALLVAVAAAMTLSAAALADSRTTAPGYHLFLWVKITDTGILVQTTEARGVIVTFGVLNLSKKPHNFTIFGKKTPILKPRVGRAEFTVTLLKRGDFPYRSTIDTASGFRGTFNVR